jgi:hypothetical protein
VKTNIDALFHQQTGSGGWGFCVRGYAAAAAGSGVLVICKPPRRDNDFAADNGARRTLVET